MVTLSNSDNAFTGSDAQISIVTQSTVTIVGDDDTISAADIVNMTVTGGNNTISASQGYVTLNGPAGQWDSLAGSTLEVFVEAGLNVTLNGGIVAFTLGDNCLVVTAGDNTSFQGSDDIIFLSEAYVGGDSVTGSHDRVFVATASLLEIFGSDNVIHFAATAAATVAGTNQRLLGAGFDISSTGADFFIGGNGESGAPDLGDVSNSTVRIGGNSNISMSGADDTLRVLGDSAVAFDGTGTSAHFGIGDKVNLTGSGATGALDTLTGAHFDVSVNTSTNAEIDALGVDAVVGDHVVLALARAQNVITAGNWDTISILWGHSDQIALGQDDVINYNGAGSVLDVGNAVGAATVNNFGADPSGIVDLLNGVGGFATAQDAYGALTGDGAGGLKLELGIYGSIDFTNTTASQLSAANFKIG